MIFLHFAIPLWACTRISIPWHQWPTAISPVHTRWKDGVASSQTGCWLKAEKMLNDSGVSRCPNHSFGVLPTLTPDIPDNVPRRKNDIVWWSSESTPHFSSPLHVYLARGGWGRISIVQPLEAIFKVLLDGFHWRWHSLPPLIQHGCRMVREARLKLRIMCLSDFSFEFRLRPLPRETGKSGDQFSQLRSHYHPIKCFFGMGG